MDDNNDLVGRIAGMAMTHLTGMSHATGVYFKVVEVAGSEAKAICTNPGLPKMERMFPVEQLRRQLRHETVAGQLAQFEDEALDYVAKCYLTERQAGEDDEQLKARLTAIGLGPKGMN
ncbi:hypothetical protein QA639_21865 [Bradyrhizobium pachyrhizi]|uniref:hypothetical protein n=1 Tax=Bradyrhizobium pachyrhizi TaxID=280333 RepID=UPI0024B1F232|nr:hypothetical protein [Bradyrhizobium pachyrhizi]WFU52357.1 hypothetical protein QA639_21865 [Bradyrhizobium pachyrhizi]